MEKLKSRKLWITIVTQVAVIVAALYPEYQDQITQTAAHVGAILALAWTSGSYVKAQGAVDETKEAAGVFDPSDDDSE